MIELLLTKNVPFQFDLCQPGDEALSNGSLCTPPRLYRQEWYQAAGPQAFWYDYTNDVYRLQGTFTEVGIAGLGNSHQLITINPETGDATKVGGQALNFNNRHVTLGSYNLCYIYRLASGPPASPSNSILEVDNITGIPSATQIANPVAIGSEYGSLSANNFHINRTLSYISITLAASLQIWNYDTTTLIHEIAYPNENVTLKTLYESDNIAYIILDTPVTNQFDVVKVDVSLGTVENYITIQPIAGTDNEVEFAFDTRRKILAVYHQRAVNATTGANEDVIEFFKMIPAATVITDPVPLRVVRVNERVKLISHVLGDHGEAGIGKIVTVTNSGSGIVFSPHPALGANGSFMIDYGAPASPGSDTITNAVEV